MAHELDIIKTAIDKLLVSGRNKEQARRQESYGTVKNSFYASELGDDERKLVYKFFADKVGKPSLTGQNVRVFDNGDYVHLRYLDYMKRLGAVLSWEQPIKANEAEIMNWEESTLGTESAWKVSGRYDQIIDLNVIKAYVEGEDVWMAFLQENYEPEILVTKQIIKSTGDIMEEKEEILWVPKEDYEPDKVLIDIKSQNEWGFNRVFDKDNHEDIAGYYDQLTYYGMQKGIEKTALVIEDKAKQRLGIVPVVPTEERMQKIAEKLSRVAEHVRNRTVPEERCEGATRSKFPCMWSSGQCDFFEHCWHEGHNGLVIEEEPEGSELPTVDELVEYLTDKETYGVDSIRLHLDNFPGGQTMFVVRGDMPVVMIEQMLDYYADYVYNLDYLDADGNEIPTDGEETPETVEEQIDNMFGSLADHIGDGAQEVAPTAEQGDLFNENGELKLDAVLQSAVERDHPEGKAINCINCGHEIVYKKLIGGVKPCTACGHKNPVQRG